MKIFSLDLAQQQEELYARAFPTPESSKRETRDPNPETRNPKPETRNFSSQGKFSTPNLNVGGVVRTGVDSGVRTSRLETPQVSPPPGTPHFLLFLDHS